MDLHDVPEKITIDTSGANRPASMSMHADNGLPVGVRLTKHLNNLVERYGRAVERTTRPMHDFKFFRCARIVLAGIEVMHLIRTAQLGVIKNRSRQPRTGAVCRLSNQCRLATPRGLPRWGDRIL